MQILGQVLDICRRNALSLLIEQVVCVVDFIPKIGRRKVVAAIGDDVPRPLRFGAKHKSLEDTISPAVVGPTIKVFNGLYLGFGETGVPIFVIRAHLVHQVSFRVKVTGKRIIDDAVLNAILGVALGEHRIPQDFQLRQAIVMAVVVDVVGKVACVVIFHQRFERPYMGGI